MTILTTAEHPDSNGTSAAAQWILDRWDKRTEPRLSINSERWYHQPTTAMQRDAMLESMLVILDIARKSNHICVEYLVACEHDSHKLICGAKELMMALEVAAARGQLKAHRAGFLDGEYKIIDAMQAFVRHLQFLTCLERRVKPTKKPATKEVRAKGKANAKA